MVEKIPPYNRWFAGGGADWWLELSGCERRHSVDIHTQWYSYWILNNALIWWDTILNTSTIQQQHSYTRLQFYIPVFTKFPKTIAAKGCWPNTLSAIYMRHYLPLHLHILWRPTHTFLHCSKEMFRCRYAGMHGREPRCWCTAKNVSR